MPQLLFELKLGLDADSCLDWGSIYIYRYVIQVKSSFTQVFLELNLILNLTLVPNYFFVAAHQAVRQKKATRRSSCSCASFQE